VAEDLGFSTSPRKGKIKKPGKESGLFITGKTAYHPGASVSITSPLLFHAGMLFTGAA
jgi:hypothetical protein